MQAGRGYSDDRKAARDALLALLGAGVLVAAAPAKRRKSLGLLAILAVLAFFLWRRAQAAAESAAVVAPESERETESSEAESSEAEAPEPHAEEEAVVEAAVEETAAEEVTAEAEAAPTEAPAEQASGFEELDAALAALIGELERVEASRLEEARIEEAKRAWREAQAEDAREQQEAEAREREEEAALVHAGRQLVHAGGSDAGGYAAEDRFGLPEEPDEDERAAVEGESEFAAEPEAEAVVEHAEAQSSQPDEVPQPVTPEPATQPVADSPVAGGLIGMIGRYSHRSTPEVERP